MITTRDQLIAAGQAARAANSAARDAGEIVSLEPAEVDPQRRGPPPFSWVVIRPAPEGLGESYSGMTVFRDVPILLEYEPGTIRQGDGWEVTMQAYYGEIPGWLGVDGEPLDVLLGPAEGSDMAYVAHMRGPDGPNGTGTYDEDKVVLGAESEGAARALIAAHYTYPNPIVAVTPIPVAELARRLHSQEDTSMGQPILTANTSAEYDWCPAPDLRKGAEVTVTDQGPVFRVPVAGRVVEMAPIQVLHEAALVRGLTGPELVSLFSHAETVEKGIAASGFHPYVGRLLADALAITKAQGPRPPGAGWQPIPGGRSGGFRRRASGKRGWDYWYPTASQAETPKQRERDPERTSGTKGLEAGALVKVGGRQGLFRWTPDHDEAPEGLTWVTSVDRGGHDLVQENHVIPTRQIVQRLEEPQSPEGMPSVPPRPPIPEGVRPYSEIWTQSRAQEGTVLYDLEHGAYPLVEVQGPDDKAPRQGVDVPLERQQEMLREFRPLILGAARLVAKNHRIPMSDRYGPTAAMEELIAGARLGFVMALSNYKGGHSFLSFAQQYARTYATMQAAREINIVSLPRHLVLKPMRKYLGARGAAARAFDTPNPTAEQVAKVWNLQKRDLSSSRLGPYTGPDGEEIDQGTEPVPLGPWKIRGTDGQPIGKELDGKIALAREFEQLVVSGRASGNGWLEADGEVHAPEVHQDLALNERLELRERVDELLEQVSPSDAKALRMRFGLDTADGEEAQTLEVAEALGMDMSRPSPGLRRDVAVKVNSALDKLKAKAQGDKKRVKKYLDDWKMAAEAPESQKEPPAPGELGPRTLRNLTAKFGSLDRARIFLAAEARGEGEATRLQLLKEKDGTLPAAERRELRERYHAWRDEERLRAFQRHSSTRTPKRGEARDFPGGGVRAWAGDLSAHDYMVAVVKTGRTEGSS